MATTSILGRPYARPVGNPLQSPVPRRGNAVNEPAPECRPPEAVSPIRDMAGRRGPVGVHDHGLHGGNPTQFRLEA